MKTVQIKYYVHENIERIQLEKHLENIYDRLLRMYLNFFQGSSEIKIKVAYSTYFSKG